MSFEDYRFHKHREYDSILALLESENSVEVVFHHREHDLDDESIHQVGRIYIQKGKVKKEGILPKKTPSQLERVAELLGHKYQNLEKDGNKIILDFPCPEYGLGIVDRVIITDEPHTKLKISP